MTTTDHILRVKKLAAQQAGICPLDGFCRCPTCGVTTLLIRSELAKAGWSAEETKRVALAPPSEACSYPYKASLRVDGTEVYRVHDDFAEVLAKDVLADVEAALKRRSA